MTFDLRVLRYFIQVVELGSLSRAARALNIAQPALSQRVASLEDHLGVQLLVRSSRGVESTAAGRELYERARDVLEQVHSIEQDLSCHGANLQGSMIVGIPGPAANVLLEPLVVRMREIHSELRLRIDEARTGALIDGLLSGYYDLAVTSSIGESGRIHSMPLAMETLHLVGPAGADLPDSISFDDVLELPLVISARADEQKNMLSREADRHGKALKVMLESTSLATTKRLIAGGHMFGIMTWSAAAEAIDAGVLTAARIIEPILPRPLFLCQVHDRRHSRAAQLVSQEIETISHNLTAAGIFR